MKLSATENTMIDAMARAFYVSAYAEQQEELRDAGEEHNCAGPGEDWMDIAPDTPHDAREFALMFAGSLRKSLLVILNDAAWADVLEAHKLTASDVPYRWKRPDLEAEVDALKEFCNRRGMSYPAELGHYLAMQAMGHGVSWFDDHARFDIDVPHVEAYL